MKNFYVTTAIPYVNAKPHVGHSLEFVQADVIARYHRLLGKDTILLSGGDENALKNVQAAEKENVSVQEFVDKNSHLFEDLAKALNVKFDVFQKGSVPDHYKSSQDLWNKCLESGDIYKKTYTGLYCVGCETFYEKSELNENGECFEHPGKKLDEVSEENYFFKLSRYEKDIIDIIENDQIKIVPNSRKNEVLSFLKLGLQDISISRSNERAKNWGVPVPDDDSQRMYVWFDALNIYRSGVENLDAWPADVHVIGKGILRFHAVYWPAFLLSAKLPLPKSLFVHGYFTVNGQKMSKTLGNVIDPVELIEKYGADSLRYYLLSQIPSTQDGDFSEEKLKTVYNADLANGLGNLVSRVSKLCETKNFSGPKNIEKQLDEVVKDYFENFEFNQALDYLWNKIAGLDKLINLEKPWELNDEKSKIILATLVIGIIEIAYNLQPFLPETAEKILSHFSKEKITAIEPLFPRIK